VRVKPLFEDMMADYRLADFLDDFSTVNRGQAQAVLERDQQQVQDASEELLL
jgi:hypothetical protein